jgi:hypothetical protein
MRDLDQIRLVEQRHLQMAHRSQFLKLAGAQSRDPLDAVRALVINTTIAAEHDLGEAETLLVVAGATEFGQRRMAAREVT